MKKKFINDTSKLTNLFKTKQKQSKIKNKVVVVAASLAKFFYSIITCNKFHYDPSTGS